MFNKAAEKGDKEACYQLFRCFENGLGVEKNADEAIAYLKKAASKDHAQAQYELGIRYWKGDGGLAKNVSTAFDWMCRAVQKGLPEAENTLGVFYEYGIGTSRSKANAKIYYQRAMEKGYELAKKNYKRVNKKFLGLF